MASSSPEQKNQVVQSETALKNLQRRVDAEAIIFMASLNALFVPMFLFYRFDLVPYVVGVTVVDSLAWRRDTKRLTELKALDIPTSAVADLPEPPHTQ